MPDPIFTFAFIIATLMGAVFHLIVGGDARRLAFFLLASWLGFAMGQSFGAGSGISWVVIGEIHILTAVLGSLIMLVMAHIFTTDRSRQRKG
ncbi:MAG: hypothetical protein RML73_14675 [Anaerolineae bacterium]|nr:hypothetical protein [Anaerolineae bacterium]